MVGMSECHQYSTPVLPNSILQAQQYEEVIERSPILETCSLGYVDVMPLLYDVLGVMNMAHCIGFFLVGILRRKRHSCIFSLLCSRR